MYLIRASAERPARSSADHAALANAAVVEHKLIDHACIGDECTPADIIAKHIPALEADKVRNGGQPATSGDDSRPSWHAHKRQRLPGRIARDLAAAILSGNYKPGDRLFGEIAFSDRLNVSRTTYRQAIQILTTKGMVSSNPRRGTIVNARSMWQFLDPEVLNLLLEIGPDRHVLEELRELLHMLAPKAAALAAERRTDAMLARMQAGIEDIKFTAPTVDRGRRACQDFHLAVFLASGNSYVISLARGLAAALDAIMAFQRQQTAEPDDYTEDHLRIFAAIAAQDADGAEQACRTLIERAFLDVSVSN